jgi:DUF4097 and DUF4098 domain-containing protein YvlB
MATVTKTHKDKCTLFTSASIFITCKLRILNSRLQNCKFRISTSERATSELQLQNFNFRISTSELQLQNFNFRTSTSELQLQNFNFRISTSELARREP